MKTEILDFINRRWQINANWLDGNCYWFAHILVTRFSELEIYYLPVQGHFVAGNGIVFYDWTGVVVTDEEPLALSDIKQTDPLWYQRLVRDCIN